jgi:hypothetical protein
MTTLEDLRKANLREQKGEAPPAPATAVPPKVEKAEPVKVEPVKTEPAETPLDSDLTKHGLAISPKPEPVKVTEPVVPAARTPQISPTPAKPTVVSTAAPEPVKTPDPLAGRMRAAVLRKRVMPAGVKATVDMSPELFWRAKRYCHDHSNATLRQLMLEILSQFLDEEGY